MPNQSPLKNGDYPYPSYAYVKSAFIKNALAIIKGDIYTKDSTGNLIVPVSTTGVADLSGGIFQAMDAALAPAADSTNTIQCLTGNKCRILMKAPAGLSAGNEVELSSSGSVTTQDTVMLAVQPHTKGYMGRIFEIYTKDANGNEKPITGANDLVVVEVGGN